MALYHDATITPTKAELLTEWVPTQSWCPPSGGPVEVIGAYRFDDPEGQVGMEAHLVRVDDTVLHVPLTYRAEPVEGASATLVGEMDHSALGKRWVYDGFRDDRFILMLTGVAMTGQGEALGMVMYKGEWVIAPTHVRIRGGGWTQDRVSIDGLTPVSEDAAKTVYRNRRFELTIHRLLNHGDQPAIGLTAVWDGSPDPMVLAEVREF